MKTGIAVVIGLLGGVALAESSGNKTPTLAEAWVGTWTGEAKWKDCSLEGDATITLPIQALGGQLTSDGDAVWPSLGAVTWGQNGDKLVVIRDGLELALAPAKKGTAKLTMTTGAGCALTATLSRGTSGMASCDAARALATVKSTCDSLDEATRDDELEQIDGKWKGWKKLKGKKKKAQAKACTAQLPQLRADVASCAPKATTVIATTGKPCDDLWLTIDALVRCPNLPVSAEEVKTALEQIRQFATSDQICQQLLDQMLPYKQQLNCP